MDSLLKKINIFHRLAKLKISVVDNNDPILLKLSDLQNFDKRIEFANKELKKIGEGSSRIIYEISEENILKLAKNEKGVAQNKIEMHPKMQVECTNDVLAADAKGNWIIVRFAEKLSKTDFQKLTGLDFDDFSDALFYKFNNESDDFNKPKSTYSKITKNPLFECLAQLILDFDLQIGDVAKISSWGKVNNKPVLIDYGLTKDLYDKYYSD